MIMKHGQLGYTSKDFYLAACLMASGFNLLDISQSDKNFLLFHFDCSEEKAQHLLEQHWAGALMLPTKKFIEAIYQLKSRMRLASGR